MRSEPANCMRSACRPASCLPRLLTHDQSSSGVEYDDASGSGGKMLLWQPALSSPSSAAPTIAMPDVTDPQLLARFLATLCPHGSLLHPCQVSHAVCPHCPVVTPDSRQAPISFSPSSPSYPLSLSAPLWRTNGYHQCLSLCIVTEYLGDRTQGIGCRVQGAG